MRFKRPFVPAGWGALATLCFSHLSLWAANPAGFGWEAAQTQVKGLKTPEGLEVKVFAAEPQVVNPTDIDIDSRGRVWVTEGANYRVWQKWGKLRAGGDRIMILEDTNGDGAADKETVFYQGHEINAALGICVLGDHVIVSCSPNVFVFTDANHDDRADGPPKPLFTGIKGVDHDHGVHAFVFGPDGKVYFNMGNEGKELHRADGSIVVDRAGHEVVTNGKPYRQGLAFRCNPDGSDLETVGWNFRNNYELCVDSFGTIWQSDNDDDGNRGVRINYVMEFGNYGYTDELTGASWNVGWKKAQAKGVSDTERSSYHWHQADPGVIPNLLQTGNGSPTGIALYEGQLLPPAFRNQIIHCDAGPRVVRAYPVQKQGAGYRAESIDLLTSADTWFRPSDVCVAPDGSLLVADWNDSGVGGHNMADQNLDAMTGRIYRVAPKGNASYHPPKMDLSSARGAIAALRSPNQATRYLAWQRLHELGAKAEPALKKLWADSDPRQQARALQLLARIPGKGSGYLDQAAQHANSDLRITALRITRALKQDAAPLVRRLIRDQDPAVRRECAIALRDSNSPDAVSLWTELALQHDGADRWYLEALGIAAASRSDACFISWQKAVGDRWDTPAGRDIVWRIRSKQAPALLVKLITAKTTTEADRARYLRSLDFIQGPEKEAALLELVTSGLQ